MLKEAALGAATFTIIAFYDPRWKGPLLVATTHTIPMWQVLPLYLDRWPVEQVPLAAKQMIGAFRALGFAAEPTVCLAELALLAGAIRSYAAATQPVVPTGKATSLCTLPLQTHGTASAS